MKILTLENFLMHGMMFEITSYNSEVILFGSYSIVNSYISHTAVKLGTGED